jgi:hypothetical protein
MPPLRQLCQPPCSLFAAADAGRPHGYSPEIVAGQAPRPRGGMAVAAGCSSSPRLKSDSSPIGQLLFLPIAIGMQHNSYRVVAVSKFKLSTALKMTWQR